MGDPFLITGLPRSRTFWLSKLAAVETVSVCEHEPSMRMGGLEDLYNYFNDRMATHRYVGISDCLVSPMLEQILQIMPMPTLIVMRPPDEVAQSLTFHGLYPDRLPLGMNGIARVLTHPRVKIIAYKDLANSYKVRAALRHVMPDYKMPMERIEAFQKDVLTIDAEENRLAWATCVARQTDGQPMLSGDALAEGNALWRDS